MALPASNVRKLIQYCGSGRNTTTYTVCMTTKTSLSHTFCRIALIFKRLSASREISYLPPLKHFLAMQPSVFPLCVGCIILREQTGARRAPHWNKSQAVQSFGRPGSLAALRSCGGHTSTFHCGTDGGNKTQLHDLDQYELKKPETHTLEKHRLGSAIATWKHAHQINPNRFRVDLNHPRCPLFQS